MTQVTSPTANSAQTPAGLARHLWPSNSALAATGSATAGGWAASGELTLAGMTAGQLVATQGSPLYAVDEADLRGRARQVREVLQQAFASHEVPVEVYYAGKSFLTVAVAKWISQEGLRLDTCSLGELEVAIRAGIPGEHIGLHGNNKSDAELHRALSYGVGRIVIDSPSEVSRVAAIARSLQVQAPVMLRVTTGVHAGGHEFISTGHEDQKFGVSLAEDNALELLCQMVQEPDLVVVGAHCHIGSQILDADAFELTGLKMLQLRAKVADRTGYLLPELDLGGGFGIAYTCQDAVVDLPQLAGQLAGALVRQAKELGTTLPALSFEPGRVISGPATVTLYTVGTVKPVQLDDGAQRVYVSVDGGMSDNIRPALYGAKYTALLANRASQAPLVNCRIVGKHCESGDIVVDEVWLPSDVQRGDILAVPATGAYGWSMSSNYNHIPKPAVVGVLAGQAKVLARRQTEQDLLSLDEG